MEGYHRKNDYSDEESNPKILIQYRLTTLIQNFSHTYAANQLFSVITF